MAIDSTKIQTLQSGIDDALSRIQTALTAEVYAEKLPIIGSELASIANGQQALQQILTLKDVIDTALQAVVTASDFSQTNIENTLNSYLTNNGFQSAPNVGVTVNPDDTLSISFGIDKSATAFSTPVDSHFGIPALELNTTGNATAQVDYQFNFTVGMDADGFYLDTGGSPELALGLNVTTPGFAADSSLGFIKLSATDSTTSPSDLNGQFLVDIKDADNDGKLRAGEGTDLAANFSGNADINLHLAADMGDAVLPSISADLGVDWTFTNSLVDPNDDNSGFGAAPQVMFSNLDIDFGSFVENFLDPILNQLDSLLEPIHQAIAVFRTEITPLEDIPGLVTVLDHAGADVNGNDAPDGLITTIDFLKLLFSGHELHSRRRFHECRRRHHQMGCFLPGKRFWSGPIQSRFAAGSRRSACAGLQYRQCFDAGHLSGAKPFGLFERGSFRHRL